MKSSKYAPPTVALLLLSSFSGCTQQERTTTAQEQSMEKAQTQKKREKTATGLEYEVLQAAQAGAVAPKKGDRVIVHYTGWLANEQGEPQFTKKFDSSVDRGTPFVFKLGAGQVIKGWDEGLGLMKVGEKRRLVLPADIAYGTRGAGGMIPPNATLVFDVELLGIQE